MEEEVSSLQVSYPWERLIDGRIAGYDQPRGPPRAGIGAQGAAQNLPVPNLAPQDAGAGAGGEKYSLFISGVPATLDDRPLYDIFEVRYHL